MKGNCGIQRNDEKLLVHIVGENNIFPKADGEFLASVLKKIVGAYDIGFKNGLYVFDADKSNKEMKDISISIFKSNFDVKEDYISAERATIRITCLWKEMMDKILRGLLKFREIKYKNFKFEIIGIDFEEIKSIETEHMLFKMETELIVKDKNGKFLELDDETYHENLNYILNLELETIRGYGLRKEIKLIPINPKKVVVREELRAFTEQTGRKYFYMNAYKGIFCMYGDIEDLNDLARISLGYRRSMGRGAIKVL